jgi:DNA/RNA-binding domain of Phe-tRNA-synthetase-like protein
MEQEFAIDKNIFELFPDVKIGIVIAKDIDNKAKDHLDYSQLLRIGQVEAKEYLLEETFTDNPVVSVWRDAYRQFKTKKGARSSIEAMLKRVQGGKPLTPINPLVDIYNMISLKYGMPCGGEDMDKFIGPVQLTLAKGDESFLVLGSEENAPPNPGEVVYKDDAGAICRCWNWREAVRTMLTEETKNAFLCMELIQPERTNEFSQGLLELKKLVDAYLGGNSKIHILDKEKPMIKF